MKYVLTIFLSLTILFKCASQSRSYAFYQLYQLDSIGKSASITKHFGELYFNFLLLVEQQLQKADSTTKRLVRNFEAVFAQFYIDACKAYQNKEQIQLPAWRAYFADTGLKSAQYLLLGANAHLNGGLSEAIANSYTPAEWNLLKPRYVLFDVCLNKTYHYVFQQTYNDSRNTRLLSFLTLGLDKAIGQYYLYKWRKRQMRLTEYYFAGSPKYQRLLSRVNRRKEKIDRLVCNLI